MNLKTENPLNSQNLYKWQRIRHIIANRVCFLPLMLNNNPSLLANLILEDVLPTLPQLYHNSTKTSDPVFSWSFCKNTSHFKHNCNIVLHIVL